MARFGFAEPPRSANKINALEQPKINIELVSNMSIDDPSAWGQGAAALKAMFDSVRTAVGIIRDLRDLKAGDATQTKALDDALDTVERTSKIAEAEMAKAFGYELCKCQFPPTVMLTVGSHNGRAGSGTKYAKGPIFECPRCGFNTADGWSYNRYSARMGSQPKHGC